MPLPNMIAYERALLHALAQPDAPPPGGSARGNRRPTVGIIGALDCLGALPFWATIIDELGFSVVVSHPEPADYAWADRWIAPPAPDVCEPAKSAHAHAANLVRRGVDAIVMPTFERGNHCPVACGYGNALGYSWQEAAARVALPPLIVPRFFLAKPRAILRNGESPRELVWLARQLRRAVGGGPDVAAASLRADDCAPTPRGAEIDEAQRILKRGGDQMDIFHRVMEQEAASVLAWLHADPTRQAVLLAGRPYHLAGQKRPLDELAQEAGFAVLSLTGLTEEVRRAEARRRAEEPPHVWKQGKRLVRAAYIAAEDEQIGLACLISFGCGFDAASLEDVRPILARAHKPLVVLPVNDGVAPGTARVRLRTLAAAMRQGGRPRGGGDEEGRAEARPYRGEGSPGVARDCGRAEARPYGGRGSTVSDDVCALVKYLLGCARAKDGCLRLPDICADCLLESVPALLGIDEGTEVVYEDFSDRFAAELHGASSPLEQAPVAPATDHSKRAAGSASCEKKLADAADGGQPSDGLAAGEKSDGRPELPRIGVMGNPLIVASAAFNDQIFSEIRRSGVQPVAPCFPLLRGEDIAYIDQIRAFAEQGIHDIVYLMPHGCMKGHVQVRGALPLLRRRFPALRLTVIDYDPDGSPVNRRNRLALALAQAREHAATTLL